MTEASLLNALSVAAGESDIQVADGLFLALSGRTYGAKS